MKPLHRSLVRAFRKHPFRFFAADAKRGKVSCGGALVGTVALGQALRRRWAGQEMVGILMPPTVAGALANYAASLMGKVPVNLNYTLSSEALGSCIEQCNIRTVVTSKAFLEQIKLDVPVETILLEDVAKSIGIGSKLVAAPGLRRCCRLACWRSFSAANAGRRWTTWPRSFSRAAAPARPRA